MEQATDTTIAIMLPLGRVLDPASFVADVVADGVVRIVEEDVVAATTVGRA
jgi:hypothetical protein